MNRYYLHWRGQQSGPFTVEEIEQKLADNEIGIWHLVGEEGTEVTVGDLLQQIDQEKKAAQLQQQQAREREQRETRQRAESRHGQALQKLQQENEVLANELETVRSNPQGRPGVVSSPFVPGRPSYPVVPVVAQRMSGSAIAAFVCALLNFVPGINFISWLIALILAYSALADMRHDPALGGRGFALAALWITYGTFILGLIVGILIVIGAQR